MASFQSSFKRKARKLLGCHGSSYFKMVQKFAIDIRSTFYRIKQKMNSVLHI